MSELGVRVGPVVSVLMTSYNYGKFLPKAIESVIGQKGYTDFELVIVDDGSTDNSVEIIQSYVERDSRIRAIFHQTNQGIARTVNEGISQVRGKYLLTMGSDDMLSEEALHKLTGIMSRSPELDVIVYDGNCIDTEGKRLGYTYSGIHRPGGLQEGLDFFKELLNGMFIQGGLIKIEFLRKNNLILDVRLKYLNDWIHWLQVMSVGKVAVAPEPLYFYRIHGSNTTFRAGWIEDSAKAYEVLVQLFSDRLSKYEKSIFRYLEGLSLLKIGRYFQGRQELLTSISLNPFSKQTVKAASVIIFSMLGERGIKLLQMYGKLRDLSTNKITIHKIKQKFSGEN